jgi:hypothetical protein
MGAALYFIESVGVVNPQLVEELGLGYALLPGCAHRLASNGPGDVDGAVCSLVSDALGFFPDRQTWSVIGERAGKRIWFGYATDSPPGPADLQSPLAIAGDPVKLFDDREWTIPRAIALENGQARLVAPAAVRRVDGGWVRGEVKSAYRRLDQIARTFWDHFRVPLEDASQQLSIGECLDMAVEVLGVNYRVRAEEVGILGLLDDQADIAVQVLKAVIDDRGYRELSQKKSE